MVFEKPSFIFYLLILALSCYPFFEFDCFYWAIFSKFKQRSFLSSALSFMLAFLIKALPFLTRPVGYTQ